MEYKMIYLAVWTKLSEFNSNCYSACLTCL